MSWKPLTAAIAATLIGSTAEAADIQHTYIRTADGGLAPGVLVSGKIVTGDYLKFFDAMKTFPPQSPGYVYLHSPGGAVLDAISIGEQIAAAKWDTVVESTCASACGWQPAWSGCPGRSSLPQVEDTASKG
jgi:hypothetical protein